ncbi:hypothetical protein A9K71_12950 [Mesorhizobium sp. WSM3873]|nr:hypothetical protein A9K71_12950 [Mesorhizobium sp. WSM3873]
MSIGFRHRLGQCHQRDVIGSGRDASVKMGVRRWRGNNLYTQPRWVKATGQLLAEMLHHVVSFELAVHQHVRPDLLCQRISASVSLFKKAL